jgi:hypothetical protein
MPWRQTRAVLLEITLLIVVDKLLDFVYDCRIEYSIFQAENSFKERAG